MDGAAVLLDDAMHDAEAQAGADAYGLGGVEGVEDVGLAVERDAAAVVADADAEVGSVFAVGERFLGPRADADAAVLWDGVDGVVEQIGPDLVEAGAVGMEERKVGGEVFFEDDLLFAKFVAEDDERGVDAVVDVDGLVLALALVGVGFDRLDEVGDAADALFDGADQLHAGDERVEPAQGVGEGFAGELDPGALELRGVEADGDQCRSHLPGVVEVCGLHPFGEGFFGVALFERVHDEGLLEGECVLLEVEHALLLFGGHGGFAELCGELVHAHEVFAELRGGAASGCSGVVELVHQACGESAERGHLLLLDGDALELLRKRMAIFPRMALRTSGQLIMRCQNCSSSNCSRWLGFMAWRLAMLGMLDSRGTSPNALPAGTSASVASLPSASFWKRRSSPSSRIQKKWATSP